MEDPLRDNIGDRRAFGLPREQFVMHDHTARVTPHCWAAAMHTDSPKHDLSVGRFQRSFMLQNMSIPYSTEADLMKL